MEMSLEAIRCAASTTLVYAQTFAKAKETRVEAKQWPMHIGIISVAPTEPDVLAAHAMWQLGEIEQWLNRGDTTGAFYWLAASQTMLWCAQVMDLRTIQQINADAIAAKAA